MKETQQITLRLNAGMHKAIKQHALNEGITVKQYITALMQADVDAGSDWTVKLNER